jgi:hypothetical protein
LKGGEAGGTTTDQGGAVYNAGGNLTVLHDVLTRNAADWRDGLGVFGLTGASAATNGGAAGNGGNAQGGGIYSKGGHLAVISSQLLSNFVRGGNGGQGPTGGAGGNGGNASGGGLFLDGGRATFIDSTVSGNMASGGYGGFAYSGQGGNGGSAAGGGIYAHGGTLILFNATVDKNHASDRYGRADGGHAAPKTAPFASSNGAPGATGGVGGAGGSARGGGLYVSGGQLVMLNGSLASNVAAPSQDTSQGIGKLPGGGSGGPGGNGAFGNSGGNGGNAGNGRSGGKGGVAQGGGLYATGATLTFNDVLIEHNSCAGGAGGGANGGSNYPAVSTGGGIARGQGYGGAGSGGVDGNGGNGGNGGQAGDGGAAQGAGVYLSGASFGMTRSLLDDNTAVGGNGGSARGGHGGSSGSAAPGGVGGAGGNGGKGGRGGSAAGGGLFTAGASTAILHNNEITTNSVTAGVGGVAPAGVGGYNYYFNSGYGVPGASGTAGTSGPDGTATNANIRGATVAGTAWNTPQGATVTNVLQGIPTGSVLLATFSGGPSESSASAYQAMVVWGDGSFDLSTATNPNVTIVLSGGNIEVFGTHSYSVSGGQTATVGLWIPGNVSVQAQATIGVATNVTSWVQTKQSMPTAKSAKITVIDPSGGSNISGSLDLLLSGLPAGVTVADASVTVGGTTYTGLPIDLTSTGVPYIHIPTADFGILSPGNSLVLHVHFNDPLGTPITFGTNLFSDPFDS